MVMDTKDTTERQARETQQHSMPEFATRNKLSCVSCASTIVPEDEQCVPAGSSPNSPNLNEKEEQEEVELREDNHSEGGHVPSEPELYMLETKNVVAFSDGDSDNPYNWSTKYKAWVVLIGIFAVLNSTVGSAIPSGGIPQLAAHFHVTNQEQLVLPQSIYLAGYVLGPLLFGPLSERYGRQIVMLTTFAGYTIFTLSTCFSPNFAAFNVFRLITGVFASSPISVTGGIYADLYDDPVTRGRAMAIFMAATSLGPSAAPTISGYLARFGWKWPYWVLLMMTGTTWLSLAFQPETYGPIILQRRARNIRKEFPGSTAMAPMELEDSSFRNVMTVVLTRPFRMFFKEAIVLCTCFYLAYLYGLQYLFFQAYPIIFPDTYHFTEGETGLAFLPIGIGAILSCFIYLYWDHRLRLAQQQQIPWSLNEDYRRLPLACLGGPFITIAMFWIGWSARSSIHWIVPMLGGLWFGAGYLIVFMALLNYLVDAYEVFAASAIAAASCARSIAGTTVPFAAAPMFEKLGVGWACSLLGFISLLGCALPFIFIRFGAKLRENSKFCQELRQRKRRIEEEVESTRVRRLRREEFNQRNVARDANKEIV